MPKMDDMIDWLQRLNGQAMTQEEIDGLGEELQRRWKEVVEEMFDLRGQPGWS